MATRTARLRFVIVEAPTPGYHPHGWERIDDLAHRMHAPRFVQRWLCSKVDTLNGWAADSCKFRRREHDARCS